MIPGQVLFVDNNEVWLAKGIELFVSEDAGGSWCSMGKLPRTRARDRLGFSRLGRRLARIGFHHCRKVAPGVAVAVGNKSVWKIGTDGEGVRELSQLVGSRPLAIEVDKGFVYYGEYRGNHDRTPVHIWRVDQVSGVNEAVATFSGLRHIHGIFFDPYGERYWVTTGDYNDESGIWVSDREFGTIKRVVGGTQAYRAVQPIFTRDFVYFGSDAPDDENYIYRLDRTDNRVERLAAVGGPVFYGCAVGDALFFSTVVEKGEGTKDRFAEVWGTLDGVKWRCVYRIKKDFLPSKLFQYGQIRFPSGPGDGENLWFTPFATQGDQNTFKVKIEDLDLWT